LQEQVLRSGPLSGTALERVAVATITALIAVHHTGLVHRDVKPGNVILGPDGARIVDFGIAGYAGQVEDTSDGVLGTRPYLAPERLAGDGSFAAAADVYAWAATIVFAATGVHPGEGPDGETVDGSLAGIPAEAAGVLRRCLDPDPQARPTATRTLQLLVDAFDPDPGLPLAPPPAAVPADRSGDKGPPRRASSSAAPGTAVPGAPAPVPKPTAVPPSVRGMVAAALRVAVPGLARASGAVLVAIGRFVRRFAVAVWNSGSGGAVFGGAVIVLLGLVGIFFLGPVVMQEESPPAPETFAATGNETSAATGNLAQRIGTANGGRWLWTGEDRETIAARGEQGELTFWDVATGKELSTFAVVDSEVVANLDVSPDGRFLATVTEQGLVSVRMFGLLPGKEVLHATDAANEEVRFSPDSRYLVVAGSPGSGSPVSVRGDVWDTRTWQQVGEGLPLDDAWTIGPHGEIVDGGDTGVRVRSPSGDLLATCAPTMPAPDSEARLVVDPGTERIAFAPGGEQTVVVCGLDGAELWRGEFSSVDWRGEVVSSVETMAFDPWRDGLVVALRDGSVQWLDGSTHLATDLLLLDEQGRPVGYVLDALRVVGEEHQRYLVGLIWTSGSVARWDMTGLP
jgi:hypothetical protein